MRLRDGNPDPDDTATDLSPEDSALWQRFASVISQSDPSIVCLSEGTVNAIERVYPPIKLDRYFVEDMEAMFRRACSDADFFYAVDKGQRKRSFGSYVGFLREKAGCSIDDAAAEVDMDRQILFEIESDTTPARKIPAEPVATLIYKYQGTLEETLPLLVSLIQQPRYMTSSRRGSLYRGEPGASRSTSEEASLSARGEVGEQYENPKYAEEVVSVEKLARELQETWSRL